MLVGVPEPARGPRELLGWLGQRDQNLAVTRRAARTAIVMPCLLAVGEKVIGDPLLATFAALGSFALLLLADFSGPLQQRLQAQAALSLAGAVLICLATLVCGQVWLAVPAMAVVGFSVLFAGVVSSVIVGASTSLLLAFILPASIPGPLASLPSRLEGWGIASGVAFIAVALLWPAPTDDRLRRLAGQAMQALAERLRSEVAVVLYQAAAPGPDAAVAARAELAVNELQRVFFATPYRPTGLTMGARAVVRLVDELIWLQAVIVYSAPPVPGAVVSRPVCEVKLAAASVLERCALLLRDPTLDAGPLRAALEDLGHCLEIMERSATQDFVSGQRPGPLGPDDRGSMYEHAMDALDPAFRAVELSYGARHAADNVGLVVAAERPGGLQRILGRESGGISDPLAAGAQRAISHLRGQSVWFHNSIRAATGLALAVLVADESGLQHGFWVVLGALSVLRSNALNTGQNALQALAGTAVGFVVGALILAAVGPDATVLWPALPFVVLIAGLTPTAISFAAGQAGFTVMLLILFNIVEPAGWRVGLIRVEDVAIGCAVSLGVGLLFWPRGAAGALGRAFGGAYTDAVGYLAAAVADGIGWGPSGRTLESGSSVQARRAAASARRLDDAFRSYLYERGPKVAPLAGVVTLVTGVAALRMAADAVTEIWGQEDTLASLDCMAARAVLMTQAQGVVSWYSRFAESLVNQEQLPAPSGQAEPVSNRLGSVFRAERDVSAPRASTTVHLAWTADHLDVARRWQHRLVAPAQEFKRVLPLRSHALAHGSGSTHQGRDHFAGVSQGATDG